MLHKLLIKIVMMTRGVVSLLFLATAALPTLSDAATIVVGRNQDGYSVGWRDDACYLPIDNVRVGDVLEFRYSSGNNNVYKMKDRGSFNRCDFREAQLLGNTKESPYFYDVTGNDVNGGVDNNGCAELYFACRIGSHCQGQQRLKVKVSAIETEQGPRERDPHSEFALGTSASACDLVQRGNAQATVDFVAGGGKVEFGGNTEGGGVSVPAEEDQSEIKYAMREQFQEARMARQAQQPSAQLLPKSPLRKAFPAANKPPMVSPAHVDRTAKTKHGLIGDNGGGLENYMEEKLGGKAATGGTFANPITQRVPQPTVSHSSSCAGFCFDFCEPVGSGKYATITVGITGYLWNRVFNGYDLGGCSDLCSSLCLLSGKEPSLSDDGVSCGCGTGTGTSIHTVTLSGSHHNLTVFNNSMLPQKRRTSWSYLTVIAPSRSPTAYKPRTVPKAEVYYFLPYFRSCTLTIAVPMKPSDFRQSMYFCLLACFIHFLTLAMFLENAVKWWPIYLFHVCAMNFQMVVL